MTEENKKNLSRRDALKFLGAAAGATVLANLPANWSTPELVAGVLPAHAQTSNILHDVTCNADESIGEPQSSSYTSGVTITPADGGITMRWTIILVNIAPDDTSAPLTGTATTDASGYAQISTPNLTIINASLAASVTVNWSFENASDGTSTCNQVFTYNCGDYMQAVAITTTLVEGQYGDFDFGLCTPNGNWVWGGSSADGATSGEDNIDFDPPRDNETLDIASAIDGTYSLYLVNWTQSAIEMTIQITTATGVHNVSFTLTADRAVADVTFPCGTVTWRAEETMPPCMPQGPDSAFWSKKKEK